MHGYANTFQDASFTMGELCHFLGREFVCAIFTWPAGGSRGLFMGYNVDRESGEFAVHHLKQAIRLIADTPGVEKLHLLAHSRGTDVMVTALRELEIEAYIGGQVPRQPVQDPQHRADVARPGPGRRAWRSSSASNPTRALPFGGAPRPRLVLPAPTLRLTVYTSEGDKALGLSEWLMGGPRARMGRVDEALLSREQSRQVAVRWPASPPSSSRCTQTAGFIGHSYFVSDPAVSADLVSLVRYGLGAGRSGPSARGGRRDRSPARA